MRGDARLSRSRSIRRRVLLSGWVLAGLVILARAAELQLLDAAEWRAAAERQHRTSSAIPAARGMIRDRDGLPLAVSHEVFRVSVAPREVGARETTPEAREAATVHTAELLSGTLELPPARTMAAVRSDRPWVVLPGRFGPEVREALTGVDGVHLSREHRRFYPHEALARGILGAVIDGAGTGGIEQGFDALLRGEEGQEILARDSQGRPMPGSSWQVRPSRAGGEVLLTIDLDLQEIAREALKEAIETTGARGGDILITDPETGEILAMFSIRDGNDATLSTINAPYEPGSTLKPFTVAALLAHGVASLADSIDTGDGTWTVAGRTLTDVSRVGKVSLAHGLRVSSNVAIARAAQPLTPAQQYETLRDFGFGIASGIELPGEASGLLRRPGRWSAQSAASLAIGYEISVTPLQMAMAYGALANGGKLMEPRIIREVRGPDGSVVQSFAPRTVRRVVPPEVTRELNEVLVEAVEEGTGRAARLNTFSVAGKSGTSRVHGTGGYQQGEYFSSFAGFFPVEDPQLVVFVKLESPRGGYYGGATAGPVTRATMEAILAARRPPVDRRVLALAARRPDGGESVRAPGSPAPDASEAPAFRFSGLDRRAEPALPGLGDLAGPTDRSPTGDRGGPFQPGASLPVPEVAGLPLRAAVRRLHAHGFRVEWTGQGGVVGTDPAPGVLHAPGDTVRLLVRGVGSGD